MANAYDEIKRERVRQDAQWGGPAHDDTHDQTDWESYIEKQTMLADHNPSSHRERMIKVAALAVAAIESYDRKHPLQVWTDDEEFVIAVDLAGVRRILVDEMHLAIEYFNPAAWKPVADDQPITITMEDGDKVSDTPRTETKTAREWVAENADPCYLAGPGG